MAKGIENEIMRIAEPVAQEMGYYLVDVEYKKEGSERFLRLYIDKDGGVGINDCEAYSRAVEVKIYEADPIEENYCLEVSSPGADRVLKTERDFNYYIGRDVEVKLYSSINGKKEFSGKLSGYKDSTALIEADGEIIKIPVKSAVYIRLEFKM